MRDLQQPIKIAVSLLFLLSCAGGAFAADTASLAGEWRFQLDRQSVGVDQRWYERELEDMIALPGTDLAQKGDRNAAKEPHRLTRRFTCTGVAWYQRTVNIPAAWVGRRITLTLERTKASQLWLDGRCLGTRDSLTTPHLYDLGCKVLPGQHRLTVLVDNMHLPPTGPALQISKDTQTNWNGILGRIELAATDPVWLDSVGAVSEPDKKAFRIRATFGNLIGAPADGTRTLSATSHNGPTQHNPDPVTVTFSRTAAGQGPGRSSAREPPSAHASGKAVLSAALCSDADLGPRCRRSPRHTASCRAVL